MSLDLYARVWVRVGVRVRIGIKANLTISLFESFVLFSSIFIAFPSSSLSYLKVKPNS